MDPAVEVRLTELRGLHPGWGADRLRYRLERQEPHRWDDGLLLIVGRALASYLGATGTPTDVGPIAWEHVKACLADAPAAEHHRSLRQPFRWLLKEGRPADLRGDQCSSVVER